jgi:hypothetical protein
LNIILVLAYFQLSIYFLLRELMVFDHSFRFPYEGFAIPGLGLLDLIYGLIDDLGSLWAYMD